MRQLCLCQFLCVQEATVTRRGTARVQFGVGATVLCGQRAHDGPVCRSGDLLQVSFMAACDLSSEKYTLQFHPSKCQIIFPVRARDLHERRHPRSVQRSAGENRVRRVVPGAGQQHRVHCAEVHHGEAHQRPGDGPGELWLVQSAVSAASGRHLHDGDRQPFGHRPAAAYAVVSGLATLLGASDAVRREQTRQFTVLPVS